MCFQYGYCFLPADWLLNLAALRARKKVLDKQARVMTVVDQSRLPGFQLMLQQTKKGYWFMLAHRRIVCQNRSFFFPLPLQLHRAAGKRTVAEKSMFRVDQKSLNGIAVRISKINNQPKPSVTVSHSSSHKISLAWLPLVYLTWAFKRRRNVHTAE